MSILVDYRCTRCGTIEARRSPSPPAAIESCAGCGAPAQRLYSCVALVGRASKPPPPSRSAPPNSGAQCRANPDVPLLCHVDPIQAPGWIARYRGNNRALDEHLAKLEREPGPPPPTALTAHHHH